MLLTEGNVLSILSVVPFFKEVNMVSKDPKSIVNIVEKNPKIIATANKLIDTGKTNPDTAIQNYGKKFQNSIDSAKEIVGEEKFVKEYLQKDYLDVGTYSTYLYYKLQKDVKMNKTSAFLTTLLCTSVGTFWTILSLGRYKFSKQLADKLVDRIKKRGLLLQTFLTLSTILFQVGLVILMQVVMAFGSILWALKTKNLLKSLAGLLYIFLASLTALIMLAKSGYGAVEGRELVKKINKNNVPT